MSGQPLTETLSLLLNLSRQHFVSTNLSSILTPIDRDTNLQVAKEETKKAYDQWRLRRTDPALKSSYRNAFRKTYSMIQHNLDLTVEQQALLSDFNEHFKTLHQQHDAKHIKGMLGYGTTKVLPRVVPPKNPVLEAVIAEAEKSKENVVVRFFKAVWRVIIEFFCWPIRKSVYRGQYSHKAFKSIHETYF